MVLTKIEKMKQQSKLEEIKRDYPWLSIIDYQQFGRLWHPEVFPYGNKARLYNETRTAIDNFLNSFHYAFAKLPTSYKNKILISRNFNDFLTEIFGHLDLERSKGEKQIQDFSHQVYLNFFNIGINGLIRTLPADFQPYLVSQIQPALSLMQVVGRYANIDLKYPTLPKVTEKNTRKAKKD